MRFIDESSLKAAIKEPNQRINVSICTTTLTTLIEKGSLSIDDVYPLDKCSQHSMFRAFWSGFTCAIAP